MDLGLKGRTALVTGASKGFGRAIALAFAKEGVHLSVVARSGYQLEKLREAIAAISDATVKLYALDLSISPRLPAWPR